MWREKGGCFRNLMGGAREEVSPSMPGMGGRAVELSETTPYMSRGKYASATRPVRAGKEATPYLGGERGSFNQHARHVWEKGFGSLALCGMENDGSFNKQARRSLQSRAFETIGEVIVRLRTRDNI